MLGIGSTELVLILFFGFLIFGPEKLPEMGRTVGRAIRQFRAASDEVNTKFREEVYDPFQEAIDPYKDEIQKTVNPIKEYIDSINDTFKDTKDMFKDPLDLKGKQQEMRDREQEFKDAFKFGGKKPEGEEGEEEAPVVKKKGGQSKTANAVRSITASVAGTAAAAAGIDVDDPFAEPASAAKSSADADELASLYDFDSEDGE